MNIIKKYLTFASLGLCAFALSSEAQVTPTTIIVLTNLPSVIPGNSVTNLFVPSQQAPSANVITLRQGEGFASAMTYAGTNAATTLGFSINWAVSLDGTNWQTTGFLQNTNAANGTNTCTVFTNYAGALVNNALFVAPCSIQNANAATNAINLGNVTVGFGNLVPGTYP